MLKVLLIEDNPADAALFQEQLFGSLYSFDIVTCVNLKEGLRISACVPVDVIFLDLTLAESEGLETMRRARNAFEELPIVVLTGLEDESLGLESLRAGAQDYLIKGKSSAEGIARSARYAIERQRFLRELQEARTHLEERVQQRTAELAASVRSLQAEVQQRKEAEQQLDIRAGQLRALAGELILAEQRERRRMAQMLHDHLQQLLAAASLGLARLNRSSSPEVRKDADQVARLIKESIDSTRSLTAELSPPALHRSGLSSGLKWLVQWMSERHGLVVNLTLETEAAELSGDVRILLFESVRELLFNVVKHAPGSSAQVSVRLAPGNILRIEVSDSGPGFDPGALQPAGSTGGGFGLFSIRERLDLIGGKMEIESTPGIGSRFILTTGLQVRAPNHEAISQG